MEFFDKNLSWTPPVGYIVRDVIPEGAYLTIVYDQCFYGGKHIIQVYLNDQGREVGRSLTTRVDPLPEVDQETPKPVARRFQFWNGFLITLHGVQEMLRCTGWRR